MDPSTSEDMEGGTRDEQGLSSKVRQTSLSYVVCEDQTEGCSILEEEKEEEEGTPDTKDHDFHLRLIEREP